MTFAARADIMRDALHRKHGANSDESNAIPAETDDGTIRKISIRDACQRAPPGADRTRVPHSLSMSEYPAQLDSRNLCVKINLVARDDPSVAAYADKSGLAYRARARRPHGHIANAIPRPAGSGSTGFRSSVASASRWSTASSPHYSRLAADLSEASGIGRVDGGFRGGFSLRVGD